MPQSLAGGELSPAAAWSQRVRKVGGYIQLAFAAFWLTRGALTIGGEPGPPWRVPPSSWSSRSWSTPSGSPPGQAADRPARRPRPSSDR